METFLFKFDISPGVTVLPAKVLNTHSHTYKILCPVFNLRENIYDKLINVKRSVNPTAAWFYVS